MKRIDWYAMVLVSSGIACGGAFESFLANRQMSAWWFLALIAVVCILLAWIDIKPRSRE